MTNPKFRKLPASISPILPALIAFAIMFAVGAPVQAAESVESIEFENGENAHVYVDHSTHQLKVMAKIQGQSTLKDVTQFAYWASSSPTIIKVEKGLLTGLGAGNAQISAKYGGYTITLQARSDYLFQEFRLSHAGTVHIELSAEPLQLEAIAVDENGGEFRVEEEAAWTSSDASVATVNKGAVTFLKEGTATITAKHKGRTRTVTITASSPYSKLEISPSGTRELLVGGSGASLTAVGVLKLGGSEDITDEAAWTSTNQAVVRVEDGRLEPVGQGTATVKANYLGQTAEVSVVVRLPYEALVVTPNEEIAMFITDDPIQLKAEVLKGTDFKQDVTDAGAWTSDNQVVATVERGKIKPMASGTAVVRIEYGGLSQRIPVTVYPTVTAIRLEDEEVTLFKKEVSDIPVVEGKVLTGEWYEIGEIAEWSSANESVAKIQNGKLVAGKPGTTELTVRVGSHVKTVPVVVKEKVLVLKPSETSYQLTEGREVPLPAIMALYEDGVEEDIQDKVEWEASDPALLIKDGKMKGLIPAKLKLKAVFLNKTYEIPVEIQVEMIEVLVQPETIQLNAGRSQSIKVTGIDGEGKSVNLSSKVTWKADKLGIVEVNGSRVKAIQEGSTVLKADFQGMTLQIQVSVVPKLKKLTAYVSSLDLGIGTSKDMTLHATFDNGQTLNVAPQATWTTSNPTVATVDKGKIKAIAKGSATIKAAYQGKSVSIRVKVK